MVMRYETEEDKKQDKLKKKLGLKKPEKKLDMKTWKDLIELQKPKERL